MEAARSATPADLSRLVELAARAMAELAPMRGGDVFTVQRSQPPPETRLAAALADDEQLLLAGTIDDAVVGYAAARLDALPDGRRLAVVDEIYVEEDARQVGVGEALITTVLEWARRHGCSAVDAVALPGHRATKNFFEESGFTARLLVMHRTL